MNSFLRVLKYGRPYAWRLGFGFSLIIALALSGLVMPLVQKFVVDHVLLAPKGAGDTAWQESPITREILGHSLTHSRFWWLTAVLGFIITFHVVTGVLSFMRTYVMTATSQRILFDMRNQVFGHLQTLSMRFYDTQGVGQIMSRVTGDVSSLNNLITDTTISIITDAIMFVVMLVFLLQWHWKLTLIGLATLPFFALNYFFFIRKMRVLWRALRSKWADISGGLYEAVAGAKVVKAFHREKYESRKVFRRMRETYHYEIQLAKLNTLMSNIAGFLNAAGTGLVLWYGGYLVLNNPDFTLGTMLAFMAYLARMSGPMMNLLRVNTTIQQSMVSADRVFGLLDSEPTVEDAPDAVDLPAVDGIVRFEDVSFSYDPEKPVIQRVNLKVDPGMMVAFVGPSGCGKTTMANLLARFYDPTEGRVTIDDYDLRKVTQKSLRRQMGVVLQDNFLFNGSVADNIRYGRQDATDQDVVQAAIAANAHSFIVEDLSEGYETDVGERGGRLSGGQKQRISIARTILRDPRILILDEATSALDSESEAQIQEALERLMVGRTSFVIAHRLSTVMKANMIVVMREGEIIEKGTHEELLDRKGMYAEMYEKQFRVKQESEGLWLGV